MQLICLVFFPNMPISSLIRIRINTLNLHPPHKNLPHNLQPTHEYPQQARDRELTDTSPNIQPTALIPDHPKKVQSQDIAVRHNDHEQRARGQISQSLVEDTEIGADEGEGDEEFQHEEGALAEGAEDRDQSVDAVEAEGRDGGDVAGGEEGGLEEVEEE